MCKNFKQLDLVQSKSTWFQVCELCFLSMRIRFFFFPFFLFSFSQIKKSYSYALFFFFFNMLGKSKKQTAGRTSLGFKLFKFGSRRHNQGPRLIVVSTTYTKVRCPRKQLVEVFRCIFVCPCQTLISNLDRWA